MTKNFPFSAIVGQEQMKMAMILTAIDPTIGGVLVLAIEVLANRLQFARWHHCYQKYLSLLNAR